MLNWASENALFAVLLAVSAVGHWTLGRDAPQVIVQRMEHDREYGRTSVAITLIAASQENETEKQVLDDVLEPLEPLETPKMETPPKQIDAPLDVSTKSVESILVAEAPTVTEFKAPLPAAPPVERVEETPDEPPPEEARRPRKRPVSALPEAELIEANAEVNYMTQQSQGVDVPPSIRSRPDPTYPARLIPFRAQASVKLTVLIGADGRVVRITVVESSGYEDMDQSAVDTIRDRWTFTPALKGEQPVEHEVTFGVNFSVRNRGR